MRQSVSIVTLVVLLSLTGGAALRAQQEDLAATLRSLVPDEIDRESLQPDITFREPSGAVRLGVRCATRNPSEMERALLNRALGDHVRRHGTEHRARTLEIPVVFHVVTRKNGRFDVTDARVERQIEVLNDAYGAHGYRFRLEEIRRVRDNRFARGCLKRRQERRFKREHAVDPATTLNIYTCRPARGILGYAWFPSDAPEDHFMHGVVLLHSSLPGGTAVPYHLGDTAVHEVGHYLGLLHTFQGGCGRGDRVGDTPEEREPAYGCPVGRDTCPAGGLDPVTNYMDYSDDACMEEFSPGQENRMDDQVARFRPSLGR